MLMLQGITYAHPGRDLLFNGIDLAINKHEKIALTGNNGSGKSTLLRLMAGLLLPAAGRIHADVAPYHVPQHFGQYNELTVSQALGVDEKLRALHAILAGDVTADNLALLGDDWGIEERCAEALLHWQLGAVALTQSMGSLSGGQKTRVFLAGIAINSPSLVLLDEPSNHLDSKGRRLLYHYIATTTATLVAVSHDRSLLNMLQTVCELSGKGITVYGGNYQFYMEQKAIEQGALGRELKSTEKALRKARETSREAMERQQKLDARGKKKQEKAGVPTIAMNTLRDNAEKSTARMKGVHAEKVDGIATELGELRKALPAIDKMKLALDSSALHTGKILVTAAGINYSYGEQPLWAQPLSLQVVSGERIAIKGANGSGKTTLIEMILGRLQPTSGTISRAAADIIYIDQDYSLIDNALTVYQQAARFNNGGLQEHEINIRLTRFLFSQQWWHKPCSVLSGGEKMRLMLCCLTIGSQAPDIIILDEPTNNLDLQNIEILTAAINNYTGTLIVISHDEYFLKEVNVKREILLE
ncbi:MAG: ABC-F family ATP-binding cassette domain-containing protein [Bacteroidota bacterium]